MSNTELDDESIKTAFQLFGTGRLDGFTEAVRSLVHRLDCLRDAPAGEPVATIIDANAGCNCLYERRIPAWKDGTPPVGTKLYASPPLSAQPAAEPVATMYRGGTEAFGRANILTRWEAAADQLPDGEHKLFTAPWVKA